MGSFHPGMGAFYPHEATPGWEVWGGLHQLRALAVTHMIIIELLAYGLVELVIRGQQVSPL